MNFLRMSLTVSCFLLFSSMSLLAQQEKQDHGKKETTFKEKALNFFSPRWKKSHSVGLDLGGSILGQDLIGPKTEFPSVDPSKFQKYVVFSGGMGWLPGANTSLFYQYHLKHFSLEARLSYDANFYSFSSSEDPGFKVTARTHELFLGVGAGYIYELNPVHMFSFFLSYHQGLWGTFKMNFESPEETDVDLYVPEEISTSATFLHGKATLSPSYHFRGLPVTLFVSLPISYKFFEMKDNKHFSKVGFQGVSFDLKLGASYEF